MQSKDEGNVPSFQHRSIDLYYNTIQIVILWCGKMQDNSQWRHEVGELCSPDLCYSTEKTKKLCFKIRLTARESSDISGRACCLIIT